MEKVFRDPVHNLMRFDIERDKIVLDLLDTIDVQRLRHIRQMGVSDFVFPGATHTRFSHSLGVVHLMKRVLDHFAQLGAAAGHQRLVQDLEDYRDILLASALLHDIGHFPFSHVMEEVLGLNHEAWSVKLVCDPASDVYNVLTQYDRDLPNLISAVLQRTFKPSYVVKLISSQLDVDRMDYLLRDSLYTGVGYGHFDLDWLIHSLRIVQLGNDYVLAVDSNKGVQVAESYVLARYYMYQQVYHHKMERAAGAMLLKLFNRARKLLSEGSLEHKPTFIAALLQTPENLSRSDFLALTDVSINHTIVQWCDEADGVLSDLAKRLLKRRIFKCLAISAAEFAKVADNIFELSSKKGFDPDYYVHFDNAVDNPYKDPYLESITAASVRIYLSGENGDMTDLAAHSAIIQAIRNRDISLERVCFPDELRSEILQFF